MQAFARSWNRGLNDRGIGKFVRENDKRCRITETGPSFVSHYCERSFAAKRTVTLAHELDTSSAAISARAPLEPARMKRVDGQTVDQSAATRRK